MSFANWLQNYRGGDSGIANIATDAAISPPHGLWGHDELRQHMINQGAGSDVLEILEHAVVVWRRERRRVAETGKSL
jgi:hypothetical protein